MGRWDCLIVARNRDLLVGRDNLQLGRWGIYNADVQFVYYWCECCWTLSDTCVMMYVIQESLRCLMLAIVDQNARTKQYPSWDWLAQLDLGPKEKRRFLCWGKCSVRAAWDADFSVFILRNTDFALPLYWAYFPNGGKNTIIRNRPSFSWSITLIWVSIFVISDAPWCLAFVRPELC